MFELINSTRWYREASLLTASCNEKLLLIKRTLIFLHYKIVGTVISLLPTHEEWEIRRLVFQMFLLGCRRFESSAWKADSSFTACTSLVLFIAEKHIFV